MSRLGSLALIAVLGACAAPVRPAPAPVARASSIVPAPAPPPEVAAPVAQPALLDLVDRADLTLVAIVEAEGCGGGGSRSWIVSGLDTHGAGATCVGDGRDAPRCVMFAGVTADHLNEVMCTKRALGRPVAVPAWAPDVLASMRAIPADQRWQAVPIEEGPRPALALTIDDALFIAIRTETGWLRSREPVERMSRLAAHRVLETSALTGSPSYGVITSSYDGGSESGTETTTLSILRPTGTALAAVASIQLGQFTWLLAAEDRRKYPEAATSLDARPHVEVQLVPELAKGGLSLRVGRDVISRELAGRCVKGDDEDINPPCVRAAMRARAGRYRLTDDGFHAVN